MAYRRYHSRTTKHLVQKSRNRLIATFLILIALSFVTLNWILPNLIGGVGFITHSIKPSQKQISNLENSSLAPPVLNIPYEATNSAQIDIKGYATSNSKVKIFIDDDLKSEVEVSSDGSFIASNVELNLGTNTIYGKTNLDEKESLPSKKIKLFFDDEKPNLEVTEPSDDKQVQSDKVLVTGKTDPNSQVFINNTRVIIKSDGSFESLIPINEGENNLIIKAIDLATNTNEINRKVTRVP